MNKRSEVLYIKDILDAINNIEDYTQTISFQKFSRDQKTIDAVVRNFEIIGEASKNIPQETKDKYVKIPWASMVGIRDKLIHEYFGVNFEVLWKTIKEDLPPLEGKISKITKDQKLFNL